MTDSRLRRSFQLTWRQTARFAGTAGVLLVAGCQHPTSPSYPLGIYTVPQPDLALVREAGFNLVTGPATDEYLDAAQAHQLRVLANPGTTAGKDFSEARAREVVRKYDRHPALWAWYLVDEPDLHRVPPEEVRKAHVYLKRLAVKKPTVVVLYQGGEALHYGNIADITMIDRYPIPWLPLANFPQHVRMARLSLGKEKPLIAVIQAFDWSYYPKLLTGETNLRPPTFDELRCMTYSALARRATGLFYYCYDDSSWSITEHPPAWTALKAVVAEVNQRLPLFEAEHLWWPYFHHFPGPDRGFNAALETSVIPALLRVSRGNDTVPPGEYLLAVNNTERELTYRITVPEGSSDVIPVLGESRSAAITNARLQDNFGPFDVHIYGPLQSTQRMDPAAR